jgi:pimeloyl-ACP methyl ester carboxylesterase
MSADGSSSSNAVESGRRRRPSMKELLREAGRARMATQKAAIAAERICHAEADALWDSAFQLVATCFRPDDNDVMPGCHQLTFQETALSSALPTNSTVLLIVPGFSSGPALSDPLIAALDGLLEQIGGDVVSAAFRWPCGRVFWASADSQIESAAAWQGAFENTEMAAKSLRAFVGELSGRGNKVVVAAHSLGCRVALSAFSGEGIVGPRLAQLMLLAPALDDDVLGADGEFPSESIGADEVLIVHSGRDPALKDNWPLAEYARCGRHAKPALGCAGPSVVTALAKHVNVLDVTERIDEHQPLAYLLDEATRASLTATIQRRVPAALGLPARITEPGAREREVV